MKSRPIGALNVGLQKDFGKKWGTLGLSYNDIFLSSNWRAFADRPDLNLVLETTYQMAERTLTLTYSRRFGSENVKGARQRATGSEEERRRVN